MIRLFEVSKQFRTPQGEICAIDRVTLTIEQGEFIAIMGPSGSGKSTLLSVMGLLSDASEGGVSIGDCNIVEMTEERKAVFRSENIGFIFQFPSLVSTLTVKENILLPYWLAGKRIGHAEQHRATVLLEQIGLAQKGDHRSFELSGGEQRRVAMARALIRDPLMILADEPTGELDEGTALDMMEILDHLHQSGRTVIMVTHDQQMAAFANRILQIREGKIQA